MIPVFYPEQKMLLPPSMLGAGRALFALEDFDRAKETLDDLVKRYGATPEAAAAQIELGAIAKKQKALEGPK
jgi:TolA-binding protein